MNSDDRPRVLLAGKSVNVLQLAAEVGSPLCASATEVVADPPVTTAVLAAAVAAHTPDPAWTATPEEANERTIEQRADAALGTNATFLALATPTAAQNAAQIKALTRQMNGLIRLHLRRFDAVG